MKKILTFITALSFSCVYAQKQPNVQQVSFSAPLNIKIDGRATELENSYQAFNKATEIYYTLANNNEVLYLTLHATKARIIQKILEGGIELTIAKNKIIKSSEDVCVVFPLL